MSGAREEHVRRRRGQKGQHLLPKAQRKQGGQAAGRGGGCRGSLRRFRRILRGITPRSRTAHSTLSSCLLHHPQGPTNPAQAGPSFVRGETVEQARGDLGPQLRPSQQAGSLYLPPGGKPPLGPGMQPPSLGATPAFGIPGSGGTGGAASLPLGGAAAPKKAVGKPRAIDSLMEEMRSAQQALRTLPP